MQCRNLQRDWVDGWRQGRATSHGRSDEKQPLCRGLVLIFNLSWTIKIWATMATRGRSRSAIYSAIGTSRAPYFSRIIGLNRRSKGCGAVGNLWAGVLLLLINESGHEGAETSDDATPRKPLIPKPRSFCDQFQSE